MAHNVHSGWKKTAGRCAAAPPKFWAVKKSSSYPKYASSNAKYGAKTTYVGKIERKDLEQL